MCNSVSFFVIHIVSSVSYKNVNNVSPVHVCNSIVSSVSYRILSSVSKLYC